MRNAPHNMSSSPDDMDVDPPEVDDDSSRSAAKNAPGKSRAGRPAQSGDSARKNKRNKSNNPAPPIAHPVIPSSPLPDAPLAASTADLPDIVEGSLEEGEDDAYGSDSEEGKKKPSKKNNNSKKNKPKARNTRNKPPKDNAVTDYDMSLLDDGDHSAGYAFAATLWENVKAYFLDLTPDDVESIAPRESLNDNLMSIPRLGVHWTLSSVDASGRPNPRRVGSLDQSTDAMMGGGLPFDLTDRPETLSSRILAALIEDHPVPADVFTIDDMDLNQQGDMGGDLPQEADANLQQQELVDQRVRYELRAVGLMEDTEMSENPREDDEICAELRQLQQQLRQQIATNNKLKAKLHDKVAAAMEQRKEQKKRRDQWNRQEKELLDTLKTKYPRVDKEKDKEKKGK
eukprot:TRINITY_DN234_c0_g1_i3.p1 TRINITY_DN234_c0_g1~~TRINITY_DN234_c0_g1_i3.p1  ORF type:complete len:400 (+),score=104.34 TRINITY_DN234_c0_g1_i3:447-1646(+)